MALELTLQRLYGKLPFSSGVLRPHSRALGKIVIFKQTNQKQCVNVIFVFFLGISLRFSGLFCDPAVLVFFCSCVVQMFSSLNVWLQGIYSPACDRPLAAAAEV